MKKTKPTKRLTLDGEFLSFDDFYEKNAGTIYKEIIELYNEFKNNKKRKLSLEVVTKISGFEWNAEFNFFRDEMIILERDILPYFIEIEDYETCEKIKVLQEELTKQN